MAKNAKKKAEKGNKVSVEYTGTLEDGTVFDTSDGKAPLQFELGSGMVIKGFDDAVNGMTEGEEKEITLEPEEAYGQRNDSLVTTVPLKMFPPDIEVKPGIGLKLQAPNGDIIIAIVGEVNGETATVDFNHPLAGKALHFVVKLVSIE